jgi:Ca2+-transporting ATPase
MSVEAAWHTLAPDEALARCNTPRATGLSAEEVSRRRARYGPNQLAERRSTPAWRLALDQFTDFMVLVLIAATGVSFALGETGDALTILAIVVMNAILGFVQEYRAERSVEALRELTAPEAQVLRDGRFTTVDARDVVPGDVVVLEAGDRVPADVRLLESWAMAVNESPLTGESTPVGKRAEAVLAADVPVGDRTNMAFLGTALTRGRGVGVVVATGMDTEMGRIAHLMAEAPTERTPLQQRLEHLGRVLVLLSLAIVLVVVATGVWRGEPLYRMFLTGVSLAVAAIPEGLPAIVTVALALGIQRMIRAHAIVRRLPAVETLGSVTVIASDKTGTLTKNEMTVLRVFAGGQDYVRPNGEAPFPGRGAPPLHRVLRTAALASTARLDPAAGGSPRGQGDPTELALLAAAAQHGAWAPEDTEGRVRVGEVPFEPERRRMAVAWRDAGGRAEVAVKGALDVLLDRCRWVLWDGKLEGLDGARRRRVVQAQEAMAEEALRVLAVAFRPLDGTLDPDDWDRDLVLVGLVGLMDPPRPEAIDAVRLCHRAGIRTVMITGDHPETAQVIARRMGILHRPDDRVMTGRELDALDDAQLDRVLPAVRVFARVSPPHKLRVVRALKRRGEIVAMTGDGVNDAPAVREADIGVAMGRTGTDVTKEASSLILTDDNFATIVRAVQEGRAIYDNIRKFIRYLLSCNVGEVLVMFLAAFIGLPLPLLPIQILFVNLVTDGLPALALGVDPPDPDVMRRPPRPPGESIFARGLGARIAWRGTLIGVLTLLTFMWGLGPAGMSLREARSLALATLIMSQLFHVFDARTEDRNFLEVGLFSNPWAVLAVGSSITMLLGILYWPPLARLFYTDPLTVQDWGVVILASGAIQLFSLVRHLVAPTGVREPLGQRAG